MKKFTFSLFILFAAFSIRSNAQNLVANPGLEEWTTDTQPAGWTLYQSVAKESTTIHGGSFSAKHISASSTQKLQQEITGIQAGSPYTISYYYYDNDPAARTRIWSYWLSGTTTISADSAVLRPTIYSTDIAEWQHFSAALTAPNGADGFRFEVRVYKQDGLTGGGVFYDDFTVSGEVSVKPEPTNYPTAFAGGPEAMGIRLNWADASGTQLPDAYLVYGSVPVAGKNILSPPVDGTPIANNMDISLGYVALNVAYGIETAFFGNFEAGQDFTFWIYPYTNSGATIDYKTDGTVPTVNVSVNNVTTLIYEPFNADLGVMTAHSITGDQVWEHYFFSNEDFARCSGYSGASFANEDWLVSPQINFTNMQTAFLSFRTAMNYTGDALKLLVSSNYDGSGDPTAFTWTDITSSAQWSAGSWAWAQSGDINILQYGNPTMYLAFVYTSSVDASSTWELDDLLVYGVAHVGLNETKANTVQIYPNPAVSELRFSLETDANIIINDMTGRSVLNHSAIIGDNRLDVSNLATGTYFISFIGNGTSYTTRFAKQ